MNKSSVFYTRNSKNSIINAEYCAQICGPSKLYPLEKEKIIDIKNLPRYIIFHISAKYKEKKGKHKDDYIFGEDSMVKKLKKMLEDCYFEKEDIFSIQQILSLNLLKAECEIYLVFIKEKIYDEDIQNYVSANSFFEELPSIFSLVKGFNIVDIENEEEKINAIEFYRNLRIQAISPKMKMEQTTLASIILQFILEHEVCILATGYNQYIRATAVEYIFKNRKFYIISECGEKYANLAINKNVALTIFDYLTQAGRTKSIQVFGKANIYNSNDEKAEQILNLRGLTRETIKDLNFEIYVIEIDPKSIELYDPSLKDLGFSNRQIFNPINLF